MKSWLVLTSLIMHGAVAGSSVITLLEDDVSEHPLCQAQDILACAKAQVDVDAILANDRICFPDDITMNKTETSEEETGTKVYQLKVSTWFVFSISLFAPNSLSLYIVIVRPVVLK